MASRPEQKSPPPASHPDFQEVLRLERPPSQTTPVVFASPHSGHHYPPSFVANSALDPVALRRSEDAFIDELYACAPEMGAPLLKALFPRAYVDPNREAFELDPAMFSDPLPDFVNTTSPRVRAGLGTIAKVVTNGAEIYKHPISYDDAEQRINACYRPYHDALKKLLEDTRAQFGAYLLIDCHSMPSIGGPMDRDPGLDRVDMVIGDAHGHSCSPKVTAFVKNALRDEGYRVLHNNPYAGGFTTRHYGVPEQNGHAIQIEINRGLYMDETTITRNDGFSKLQEKIRRVVESLATINPDDLYNA